MNAKQDTIREYRYGSTIYLLRVPLPRLKAACAKANLSWQCMAARPSEQVEFCNRVLAPEARQPILWAVIPCA